MSQEPIIFPLPSYAVPQKKRQVEGKNGRMTRLSGTGRSFMETWILACSRDTWRELIRCSDVWWPFDHGTDNDRPLNVTFKQVYKNRKNFAICFQLDCMYSRLMCGRSICYKWIIYHLIIFIVLGCNIWHGCCVEKRLSGGESPPWTKRTEESPSETLGTRRDKHRWNHGHQERGRKGILLSMLFLNQFIIRFNR